MKIDSDALKQKLIHNKIEEVLMELKDSSKQNTEKYNQIILVLSQYKKLENDMIVGIENSNSELQRVKLAIIKIIDELDKNQFIPKPEKESSATKMDKIKSLFQISDTDASNLIFHLGESKYEWRKATTLELKTGLAENELTKLARAFPDIIERGKNNNGEILFKLKSKFRSLYKNKIL